MGVMIRLVYFPKDVFVRPVSFVVLCNEEVSYTSSWVLYRRTSHCPIALGENKNIYKGSRQSACGPDENIKKRLSSLRKYRVSLVVFVLMSCTDC